MTENNEKSDLKEIVYPGEVLTDDMNMLPGRGAVRDGDKIRTIYIGLKNIRGKYVNVVPLKGKLYTPSVGDKIIGKVVDKNPVKWRVDINAKDTAMLRPSDVINRHAKRPYGHKKMSRREMEAEAMKTFNMGDMMICKILSCDRVSSPVITTVGEGLGKVNGGIVMQIDVPKIPRIIGKRGSMIKLLKNLTHCKLFVAKNGRVWLKGNSFEHERVLMDAIMKIERESHTSGLTDRIEHYIKTEKENRGIN